MKIFISMIILFASCTLACSQTTQDEDRKLVKETVNDYLAGRTGSPERLERAFLPTATLRGINRDEAVTSMPIADYIAMNTPGKKHDCTNEIALIDISQNVGVVKVIIRYATHEYHDYLVLMKVKGEWRIVDKVYSRKNLQ